MAKPERQSQAERRKLAERRLIDATIHLISERGFDRFTLAEVGESAGYSRGLPAHYFGSKDALLLAVADHIIREFMIARERSMAGRGLSSLLHTLEVYGRELRANPAHSRATAIIFAEAPINSQFAGGISTLAQERLRSLENEIKAGIDLGNIRADVQVEATAAVIYAFLRGSLALIVADPGYPIEASFKEFGDMLVGRIGSDASLTAATSTGKRKPSGKRQGGSSSLGQPDERQTSENAA